MVGTSYRRLGHTLQTYSEGSPNESRRSFGKKQSKSPLIEQLPLDQYDAKQNKTDLRAHESSAPRDRCTQLGCVVSACDIDKRLFHGITRWMPVRDAHTLRLVRLQRHASFEFFSPPSNLAHQVFPIELSVRRPCRIRLQNSNSGMSSSSSHSLMDIAARSMESM